MLESLKLRDATVQDIQLELIRRTQYNAFDGERVAASLLKHRDLWLAVILDRFGHANYAEPRLLLTSSLIKLRDLSGNFWNADTLFVLTKTKQNAKEFARIADEEGWAEEIHVYDDDKEISGALGAYGVDYGLVSIWWD
jgi:hypothetical protein